MTYSESKDSVNEEIEQVATEDTNKSEESAEQIIDNEGGTEQPEELNVPESISVQSLDEALQISVANGDENATSTDRGRVCRCQWKTNCRSTFCNRIWSNCGS